MRHRELMPYLVCLAAGLFSFYDVFQLTLFNVISKNLLATFSFTHFTLGLFSASFLLANALWIVPAGRLLDKYSERTIGLLFFELAIVATMVVAFSHNIIISSVARIVQGMASATSLLLCTRIASIWFEKAKGCAIGCMFAMASLGGLSANTFWPALVNTEGWRISLFISACIGILFYLYVWLFLQTPRANKRGEFVEFKTIKLMTAKVFSFGLYIGLMSLPLFILGALWGNIFISQTYHLSLAQAGVITGMLFWGMLPGMPFIGRLNDKLQKPYFIMASGPMVCLGLILIVITSTSISFFGLCSIFFFIGVISSCQGLAFAQLASEYPLAKRSTAIAIAALAENLIGTVAQPLFGKVIDMSRSLFTAHPLSWHYKSAMVIFPIAFFLCTLLIIIVKVQSSAVSVQEFSHATKY